MIPRARRAGARRRWPGSVRRLAPPRPVVRIDPTVDPRWLDLLARYPRSGLFHSPAWLRAVADTYGFAVRAHILTDPKGMPIAGIAVAEVDDLSGPRTIALPFSDACDPLVSSVGDWEGLFDSLRPEGLPIHLRCLDDRIASADPRFDIVKRARWHTLSLASEPEAIWGGLAPATRRAIRKAERSGVTVAPLAGAEGVCDFHRLHVGLRKAKYRLLAQPIAFFEAIANRFGEIGG
ncbi:MAG TPA: hypothetical protein VIE46_03930, partial [Gemmatimonadales bacterium]